MFSVFLQVLAGQVIDINLPRSLLHAAISSRSHNIRHGRFAEILPSLSIILGSRVALQFAFNNGTVNINDLAGEYLEEDGEHEEETVDSRQSTGGWMCEQERAAVATIRGRDRYLVSLIKQIDFAGGARVLLWRRPPLGTFIVSS